MRHIPNILSTIRILMIGVFLWFFFRENYLAGFIVYAAAFFTDVLDGYLARKNNWITNIGKVLDPLADKLMLMTVLVCCCVREWIPVWLVAVMIAKELLMIIGGYILMRKKIYVYADWVGKLTTGVFTLGVSMTLLCDVFKFLSPANIYVLCVAMALTLFALVHYARKSWKNYYCNKNKV